MSRLAAVLVTQQRSLDAWPVKQDAPPAQPHTGDYAGRTPVEQRAAADWQPRQQLLLVNEASFAYQSLALFAIHSRTDFIRTGAGDGAIIAQNDSGSFGHRRHELRGHKLSGSCIFRVQAEPLRQAKDSASADSPADVHRQCR